MKTLGIIPARYESSRFPGKPLAMIGDKSMIRRVYEQAGKAKLLNEVFVATDDDRIVEEVKSFGGNAIMTSPEHKSGTDRCHEALLKQGGNWDAVINIQGDEPFIDPVQIDLVVKALDDIDSQIATLAKKIDDVYELESENVVKALFNNKGKALYFSRVALPYYRGKEKSEWLKYQSYYKHIGIYGYRADVLKEISSLPVSPMEVAEKLEQLRWLESGYRIRINITDIDTLGVDTPEDLERLKAQFSK